MPDSTDLRPPARAATRGRRVEAAAVFGPGTERLGSLHNPKNPLAFWEFDGVDGLLAALRTNRTGGLGAQPVDVKSGGDPSPTATATGNISNAVSFPRLRSSATWRSGGAADDAQDVGLLRQRRAVFGDNRLPTRKQPHFIRLMWMAYNDPVLFLLTAAAAISLAVGLYQTFTTVHTPSNPPVEWVEGVAILVAVVIIVLVGSVNDWEKQRQFRRLNQKQLERDAKVVRFGELRLLPAAEILVGDVVRLEPGDVVPADGILLDGYRLMCDESTATGETELVEKLPGDEAYRAMAEDGRLRGLDGLPRLDPFMLSGTRAMDGTGTFLVTATGIRSSYGRILAALDDESDPTPLQARLAVLAKQIAWIGGVLAGLLFIALLIRFLAALPRDTRTPSEKGQNFIDIVIIALTVLVIAVPEGLPLAVTLALAYATTRMLKDGNLVRQLRACETMGNATNICSDKTGTMTQNKMVVVAGLVGPGREFDGAADSASTDASPSGLVQSLAEDVRRLLRQSIALNSTAFDAKDRPTFVGSHTECALLTFAKEHLRMGSVSEDRTKAEIVEVIPFNASRKCMITVTRLPELPEVYRVFVKGAPEVLLPDCSRTLADPTRDCEVVDMDTKQRLLAEDAVAGYAGRSLRTIGLFYLDLLALPPQGGSHEKPSFDLDHLLKDLIFLGIFGIHDPLRPGVPEAVHTCHGAGVTVRMVTGDNILTAKAIALRCGILSGGDDELAIEGVEFRAMSDDQLRGVVRRLRVLARSTPEDKQRLVLCLKSMGETVAVTGDGTNDAPAMSAADVSFSMGGISGTEVAREASSIILLTDDFSSIIHAIMWGRTINDSVKKFLQFQISITITSVLLTMISAISNPDEQSVLTPVQLMWINLFQDTLAALALATDRPQKRLLDRPPEPRLAPLITASMWKTIIGQSAYQLAVTLVLYFVGPRIFAFGTAEEKRQVETLVFNTYVWMQVWNMYNCRQFDNTLNVFEGVLSNWLFLAVSTSIVGAQVLIMFVGGQAFSVERLTGPQWATSLVLGLVTLPIGVVLRLVPDRPFQKVMDVLSRSTARTARRR